MSQTPVRKLKLSSKNIFDKKAGPTGNIKYGKGSSYPMISVHTFKNSNVTDKSPKRSVL